MGVGSPNITFMEWYGNIAAIGGAMGLPPLDDHKDITTLSVSTDLQILWDIGLVPSGGVESGSAISQNLASRGIDSPASQLALLT